MSRKQATRVTDELKEKFLELLMRNGGIVSNACEDLHVSRKALYVTRKKDPVLAKAWEEAQDQGIDVLEDEAKERALNGTEEPVYFQGEVCGYVRRKSDTLMCMLLKAHRPKYRDRHEITGADGKPLGAGEVVVYLPNNGRDLEERTEDLTQIKTGDEVEVE